MIAVGTREAALKAWTCCRASKTAQRERAAYLRAKDPEHVLLVESFSPFSSNAKLAL